MHRNNAHVSKLAGINLNLLVALDALLTTRSVTDAAKQIGITQPAMSHSLAKLRDLFEDRLLVRTPKGLAPTVLAKRLRPELRRCLSDLERTLLVRDRFDAENAKHTFTIATADFVAALVGPRLVPILSETSAIDVRLVGLDASRIAESLRDGEIDLAIGPKLRTPSDVDSRALGEEPFVCAMRAGHPLAPAKRLTRTRFASLSHLQVSPTGRGTSALDVALRGAGLQRRIVLRSASFLEAMAIAAESDLVVTLPQSAISRGPFREVLRSYPLPLEVPALAFSLYWHARRNNEPRLEWIRTEVESLEEHLWPFATR